MAKPADAYVLEKADLEGLFQRVRHASSVEFRNRLEHGQIEVGRQDRSGLKKAQPIRRQSREPPAQNLLHALGYAPFRHRRRRLAEVSTFSLEMADHFLDEEGVAVRLAVDRL